MVRNILNFSSKRNQSLVSNSTSSTISQGSSDNDIGNCSCCGTLVKIPSSVVKFKCSACQTTVTLRSEDGQNNREINFAVGLSFHSLKKVVRKCEGDLTAGLSKHAIYKPVEDYLESVFTSTVLLTRSFMLSSQKNSRDIPKINYEDLDRTYNLITSLPTIRPYFKLLTSANELLRRPPCEMTDVSNVRWLLILFELPTLADCLYYEREQPKEKIFNRFHAPEVKSLSYEIIKRLIGYLSNSNSESLEYLSSCLVSLPITKFSYKVQLLNLYITFHLTRLINRNLHTKTKGLSRPTLTNQIAAANSPTFAEYSESSKLNTARSSACSTASPAQTTMATRTWIQLPISIQNGFSSWGVWRRVLSSNDATRSASEVPKTSEIKLKSSDYGTEWHLKSAARLLSMFFVTNKSRLEIYNFYNTLVDYVHIKHDFDIWENNFKKPNHRTEADRALYDILHNGISHIDNPSLYPSKPQFTFCQYPFLLSLGAKISILEYEARKTMEKKAEEAFLKALDKRKIINVNLRFLIRRDHITIDSLNSIKKNQGDLKKALKIEFVNEPGIDVGGLKKEWFLLLTKELFNVKGNTMFLYNDESHLCWFAPMPVERNDELYYMLGVVLGLAIYNSTILELRFPLALYKKLLNKKVTLDDYTEMFPTTGKNLKSLLSYKKDDFQNLGLTFETEFHDYYGKVVSKPLIPNGGNLAVNYGNRKEYVKRWVDFYLNTIIEAQFRSFYSGFHAVIGGNALSLFAPKEIEMLICGYNESKIEVESFKAIAKYNGWSTTTEAMQSEIVQWFWEWFEDLDYSRQKLFLTFVTGSDRIPATGVSTMSFSITRLKSLYPQKVKKLPIAHTCFNELCLYDYQSKGEMTRKLDMSIFESEGFGLR